MGDPRKKRKKYKTPTHPWQAQRIKEEHDLKREYGLANKKEIWKMAANLRNWQERARTVVGLTGKEKEVEEKILLQKLQKLGVLDAKATIDDVLALTVRDVLERRLQTKIYKMGLANTSKQARQFIIHNKVLVNDTLVNAPSYFVQKNDRLSLLPGFKPQIVERIKAPKPALSVSAAVAEELREGGVEVGEKE